MRLFRRPVKLVFILLAVVVLLIFLHYSRILGPLEGLVQRIIAPIQHQLYVIGTTINNFYSYSGEEDIFTAKQKLEEQVQSLITENAQLKILLLEKDIENQQVDFLTAEGLEAVTAKIVGRSIQSDQQTFIINKGRADGVEVGAPVIAQQGIIVGQIASVNSHSAHIRLVNDSLSSFGAMIQNETLSQGVVHGDRGLSLKMELIPQGEEIIEGDLIVTSGVEANVPRGLVIGQIEQIISEPNNLFQEAFVKTLVDFDNLIIVSVLKYQYDN